MSSISLSVISTEQPGNTVTSSGGFTAQTGQEDSVNIQATPSPATPATNPHTLTAAAEPVAPVPEKNQETVRAIPTTPEPANQPVAAQQPERQNKRQQTAVTGSQPLPDDATSPQPTASSRRRQSGTSDVSEPVPVYANVEEKVIQEFKREIRPLVIRMEDEHIANGGFTESDGKRYIWINDNYVKLRNTYTSKHFNPIKNKLINKYKHQLTDFEKYDLPQQFEIAISEVSNDYLRSIGMH